MKRLIATLGLFAAVAGSFAASTPARADEAPQLMPSQIQPDLGDLRLKPILPLSPQYLILLPRAELTSRVTVVPYPGQPAYRIVWCYVKNSGLKHSGVFKTLIRVHRNGPFPWLPLPKIEVTVPMALPAGAYQIVGFKVWAPWGVSKAFSYADSTFVTPEYVESNNFDFWP
jgi:hypothetical protein